MAEDVDRAGEGSDDAPQQSAERGAPSARIEALLSRWWERFPHSSATRFAPVHHCMLRGAARSSPPAVACPTAQRLQQALVHGWAPRKLDDASIVAQHS